MQNCKPRLPPGRPVLVILPLSLIEALDQAADALEISRSDLIRRSRARDVVSSERRSCSGARGNISAVAAKVLVSLASDRRGAGVFFKSQSGYVLLSRATLRR